MESDNKSSLTYIYNNKTLLGNESIIKDLHQIYLDAFPDINEREEFDVVIERVRETPVTDGPNTFFILDIHSENNEQVLYGGVICDWYYNSRAIHLTYIIVDKAFRDKGVAKRLIYEGIPEIKKILNKEFNVIAGNIYFESNNPFETDPKKDSFDPLTRLKVFSKLEAKLIDLKYVQPSLDEKKARVRNLFLLTFPLLNSDTENVKIDDVLSFLSDLYKGLGTIDPDHDNDYIMMQNDLRRRRLNLVNLKDLPIENNLYQFHQASVAFHFVEKPAKEKYENKRRRKHYQISDDSFEKEKFERCLYFTSYEKDLLNFQNQEPAPFKSSLSEKLTNMKIMIEFPEVYTYYSEGREEKRKSERRTIEVQCSISSTIYFDAGIRIWHMVISPVTGTFYTEHDLIKLINYFGSKQEYTCVSDFYPLNYNNRRFKSFTEFLCFVAKIEDAGRIEKLITGVVEIETKNITSDVTDIGFKWESFYELLKTIKNEHQLKFSNINEEVDEKMYYFLKVMCGLILGIFDYDRMGGSGDCRHTYTNHG